MRTNKKIILCLLAALFIITNASIAFADNGYTVYSNPAQQFSVMHPAEWATDERELPNMFFFEAVDPEMGVNFNITVASDQGAPLSAWIQMIGNELSQDITAEIANSEVLSISGHECSLFQVIQDVGGYQVVVNNYVLLFNGSAYMINFTCPGFLYPDYQEVELEIIESIVIN